MWPWVLGGVGMVALGFVVGSQLSYGPSAVAAPRTEAAESPVTSAPDGPVTSEESESTLPDEIVPPLPPDSTLPDGSLAPPDDPDPDDPTPQLELPVPDFDALFSLPEPPAEFNQSDGGVTIGPRGIGQSLELTAPDGRSIRVEASIAPMVELPPGRRAEVRGIDGVWSEDGTLVWIEDGTVLFRITGSGVDEAALVDVAERLEVS